MLCELLTSPVGIRIEGVEWQLVVTNGVLLECGRILGIDAFAEGLDLFKGSARTSRALLWACLARAGADLSLDQAGDLIRLRNGSVIRRLLLRAWRESLPEPEESDAGPRVPLTAMRAWAQGRISLGLSTEEWLEMTPRQFHALSEARMAEIQRQELLVGILASTTANFSPCHPKKPLTAESFMIHRFERPKSRRGPLTGEMIMAETAKLIGK